MPRVGSEKQYNSFVKGLITEASPLTFPENAFSDGDNVVLKRDGSVVRRLGLDYEDGYTLKNVSISGSSLLETRKGFYKWNFAGGSASLGVVRVRNKLYFLDMASVSPSSALKNGGLAVILPSLANAPLEATVINGKLVLVSSDMASPVSIEYDVATDTISYNVVTIEVRDFWGVEDSLPVDERPTTLTNLHKYNLLNQGWSETNATLVAYPSNADIWTLGKDTSDNFSKATLLKNSVDKAYAPRGKNIINAFYRGTSRFASSLVSGLPQDYETGRLSTVTTYAGRVWYSGVASKTTGGDSKSPNYSGSIFFSKTISSDEDLGICYQEADPTSEYISDIIDTDGGVISIVDANKVIKLVSSKNSLVVFAENGIWEIYGSDSGFKATDYQLSKVTNIGISNGASVVVAGDTILYWAKNGIFVLSPDQATGRLQAQNISLPTIQTYYNNIPSEAREEAKGFYDQKENMVRWLYSESSDDEYNKELVLDLSLQAFFTNTISNNTVFIADYVEVPNYVNNAVVNDVYVDSDVVMVGANVVQVESTILEDRQSEFSFLVFTTSGSFTLAKYKDRAFVDWEVAEGGLDYSSYIVTGYELFGDIARKKQATYLVMVLERTEDGFSGSPLQALHPSSCLVQAQWNWTNSAASGKWGNEFQTYRYIRNYTPSGSGDVYNTGDRVILTKNKLRGVGRALSLYIHSETGKDMRVLGWVIPMTGNSVV